MKHFAGDVGFEGSSAGIRSRRPWGEGEEKQAGHPFFFFREKGDYRTTFPPLHFLFFFISLPFPLLILFSWGSDIKMKRS